jgi:hypothetical protein
LNNDHKNFSNFSIKPMTAMMAMTMIHYKAVQKQAAMVHQAQ